MLAPSEDDSTVDMQLAPGVIQVFSDSLSRVVPVLPDPEIQNSEGTGRLKVSGRRLQLVRCAYLLS